jgi:hypothetical protein
MLPTSEGFCHAHMVSSGGGTKSLDSQTTLGLFLRLGAAQKPSSALQAQFFRLADNHERAVISRPNQQIAKYAVKLIPREQRGGLLCYGENS